MVQAFRQPLWLKCMREKPAIGKVPVRDYFSTLTNLRLLGGWREFCHRKWFFMLLSIAVNARLTFWSYAHAHLGITSTTNFCRKEVYVIHGLGYKKVA